jgi:hypothetical protein
MIYEIILVDGTVLKCWTDSVEGIVKMMFRDNIYIVRENEHPELTTYILPERVSHYRFPKDFDGVVKPR